MAGVSATCVECEGRRFQPSVPEHRVGDRDIAEVLAMSVLGEQDFFGSSEARTSSALANLGSLADVGLGYLGIGQPLATLSDGELQRLKLASHLDESAAGLHPADVELLLALHDRLVKSGKTVTVIEHRQAAIAHSYWIIDLGRSAGHGGGTIVFEGPPAGVVANRSTQTGKYLAEYVGR